MTKTTQPWPTARRNILNAKNRALKTTPEASAAEVALEKTRFVVTKSGLSERNADWRAKHPGETSPKRGRIHAGAHCPDRPAHYAKPTR
ncbi:MAG TPA: hypothetical protein VFC78_04895 [Tepidisphaeraceae bacterium]|nr:hypothetical protein [Tepidisphaeraceae bacterium]